MIQPMFSRKEKRDYDRALYTLRACGGERFPGVQAVAGSGDPVCQELPFGPGATARFVAMAIWTKLL